MGMIYKRGKVWWLKFYKDGVPFRESVKGAILGDGSIASGLKQREAERLLNLRTGSVERGMPVNRQAGRLTFEQAMDAVRADYQLNNRRSYSDMNRRIVKHLGPYFQGRRLLTITTTEVNAYLMHRKNEGASNASCNREVSILKHAFSLALKAGTLHARPFLPTLAEDNARAGFFEPDQLAAVLRHLPDPLRPLVRFCAITGWRCQSEAQRLLWAWVDVAAGEVRLPPGVSKTREPRVFVLTAELRALLTAQRATVDAIQRDRHRIVPTVFCWPDGRPIKDLRAAWAAATEQAGCPGRLIHDLRRTAIRSMVRAGISEAVAMRMAGHKTRAVFDRYNITSAADLRAAAEQLDAVAGAR